jgi:uncharacterized protein YrrD
MEFHIGAPILDVAGEELGHLRHVIVDPDTKEVAELVLDENGWLGRDVIIPVGAVNTAEHDGVGLQLTKEQAGKLQSFEDVKYIAPDAVAMGQVPWATGALMAQEMMPVGAAAGVGAVAFTPVVETTENIPEGDVDIQPGTGVWATDGKVGSVHDVLVDEQTKRVRGFIVQKGLIFHTDVEVGLDKVADIASDRVTLKVSKAELAQGK